jgi:hypothetical protein
MTRITRADTAQLGYCHAGVRAYFAQHQISWTQFIGSGLPVSAFAPCRGDPMIERLIQAAEARGG